MRNLATVEDGAAPAELLGMLRDGRGLVRANAARLQSFGSLKAKTVVVSGGAINSPALLLRSGLDGNGNVGKRFFLHPVVIRSALMPEPVVPWSGAPQAADAGQIAVRVTAADGAFTDRFLGFTVQPRFAISASRSWLVCGARSMWSSCRCQRSELAASWMPP